MTDPAPEVALTADEIREILSLCGPEALLVGGQALALWAVVYDVTPPDILAASISSDADFIGSADLARKLGRSLKHWDFWKPKPDDATVQTAKLSRTVTDGIKQIDFLAGIAGLATEAVQRRAPEPTCYYATLRLFMPVSIASSPAKSTEQPLAPGAQRRRRIARALLGLFRAHGHARAKLKLSVRPLQVFELHFSYSTWAPKLATKSFPMLSSKSHVLSHLRIRENKLTGLGAPR